MHQSATPTILSATGAQSIRGASVIQSLWSGYGEILRLDLEGGNYPSVILKHIKLPDARRHPRGWNTSRSHNRKVRSYQVEAYWYQHYADQCDSACTVPRCLAVSAKADETLLVLTDLNAMGFDARKEQVTAEELYACIGWLAGFHAQFLGSSAEGLWECGSYWHLDTRPDELGALDDVPLRNAAPLIDRELRQCRFQTLIHGDAKLANFCFTSDTQRPGVSAVDFQYVGQGCGMKDLAYFLGSCLREDECEAMEGRLLDYYFFRLRECLSRDKPTTDGDALEKEWRDLYDVAWADFHRFLKGWSPGHWKINSYSERLSSQVIERLQC